MDEDRQREFLRKTKEWFSMTEEEREHRMRMETDPRYAMRVRMQQGVVLKKAMVVGLKCRMCGCELSWAGGCDDDYVCDDCAGRMRGEAEDD